MSRLVPLCTLVALTACGGHGDNIDSMSLAFAAVFGSQPAACNQDYVGVGTGATTVQLKDLRFYVSNVRLIAADGSEAAVTLTAADTYQSDRVALVDLEDGTGACATNSPETHAIVAGEVAAGDYAGLAFDVAVPFDLNHGDASAQEPPLNASGMFWAWGIGHKFMKVDLSVPANPDGVFNVHLGSTMCNAPDMGSPPTEECARPNRMEVRLPTFDVDSQTVVLDLAALYATSNVATNTASTAFGCQSFPDDPADCGLVFTALGMDFSIGGCVNGCSGQTVFGAQ